MERNPCTTIPQPKHNKVNFEIEKKKPLNDELTQFFEEKFRQTRIDVFGLMGILTWHHLYMFIEM
jgi:hypothetical protein